jgi:uncharacterized protein (TIGR02270 family)
VPSALVAEIIEQHAAEASFLWSIRDAAAVAPHYDLAALGGLDERIEAHLDGLRVGGPEGLAAAEKAIDPDEPGTAFALAVLAVERGDAKRTEAALELAASSPGAARAVVSALGWLPFDRARGVIAPLIAPSAPAARKRIGIAASAAHRQDPGEALAYAILDDDARLKARALRAAGELGRVDLLDTVRSELRAEGDERRFWAGSSAMLLGDEGAAHALWSLCDAGGPFAERACALSVRKLEPREARARLENLGVSAAHARSAAIGAGALGDPALGPWLVGLMADPALARVAAEAFAEITGAAIEGALAGSAPEGFDAGPTDSADDESVAMDPDWALRWPEPKAIGAWWAEHEGGFRRGARYLRGAARSDEALERDLREGSQRRRAAAAFELGLRRPGKPLVEVRARASWQIAAR